MKNPIAVNHEEQIELTPSLENYLEAIFTLEQPEGKAVRLTDISQLLSVSKASVNRAIRTLKQNGLVHHEHYGTVGLTTSGKLRAEEIYRRHTVLQYFLTDFLGVDPVLAEKEACLMEHSIRTVKLQEQSLLL